MRRWLMPGLFGLVVSLWAGVSSAADKTPLPYQPDAIPLHQYMKVEDSSTITPTDPEKPKDYFLTIYSGSTRGTYFYIASALCQAVHAEFAKHHIHCVPLRSQGVLDNVSLMNQGRAQFIIVQSDTNYYAATGKIKMPGGRSVMSLHDELGLLAVRPDSGIKKPADLRGKRINLGPEGTAARALWKEFLDAQGIGLNGVGHIFSVTPDLNAQGLCGGYIDAFGLWIGHPVSTIARAIEDCNAQVVGMWSPETAKLVQQRSFYFRGEIPAGTYANQTKTITSYGFKASLIAYQRVDPYIVYWLVKSVEENLGLLRKLHPALASVNGREMFEKGNFLPFHRGAARYWREVGWLKTPQIN